MRVFVIMPFTEEFNDTFQIGIKETAKEKGIDVYRLDEQLFDEGMLDRIYKEIENCDFIIADLSNKNPNVFYELGYAHAVGRLCILITNNANNIPFDLKHKRHIVYGNSLTHLKQKLALNLDWAASEIEDTKTNPFEVELKTSGNLESSDEYAKAVLDLLFDIENKSNKSSPEIHAMYLYSTRDWHIKQNGRKVPTKNSDLKPYSFKYQLNTDTPKIPKKGWTQIELQASRIIANTWEGDKIKDNYAIQGHMLFEISTDKGLFSRKLTFSLNIDSYPF